MAGKPQLVKIQIDPMASWDIDYVALLIEVKKLRVRPIVWHILEIIGAAAVGAILTKIIC